MAGRAEPIRTCLGCRQRRPKTALVRLVRGPAGRVTVDPCGRAAGRGAYVCADRACVERAWRAARWSQAFRRPTQAPAEDMTTVLTTVLGR